MALFESGENNLCLKAGPHVALTIPGKGTLRRTPGGVGSFGYSVSVVSTAKYFKV